MKSLYKLTARPKLNAPNLLAAWPGVGNVSIIVANYLLRSLDFKELGSVEASYFFDPIGVIVKDSMVEAPQFPQSQFYYWKNRGTGNDLILFIGESQPTSKGYELAGCVLDMGLRFQVGRVYTCAAALSRIHHTEQPRVWGVANSQPVVEELTRLDLVQKSDFQIAGLNGLLLGVAKERNIDAICLLGEVPTYASQIQNPMAALAVIKVLTSVLDISLDTTELAQIADEAKESIRQIAADAMGKYIDYLTMPVWEQGDEEEDEDEEEED